MATTQYSLPPCTRQFGFCYCGPLDYGLSLGHAALTGTFIAALTTGHSYIAIGVGIGEVALIASHVLYQKYGNIAKVVAAFNKGVKGLQTQVDNANKLLKASEENVAQFKTENDQLHQESLKLTLSVNGLNEQVETIGKQLAEFSSNNESLHKLNEELKGRASEAEQTIQQYKAGLSQFAKGNEQLGSELRQISISIPGFEKTEGQLASTVGFFDKDLSQFLSQMAQNQGLSKQIIGALQAQTNELQAKIVLLQSNVSQVGKDETLLAQDEGKMQEAERGTGQELLQLRQTNQALATEIEQLKKEQSERNQEFDKLKALLQSIHAEREQFTTAGDQIIGSFNKLQQGFVADAKTLADQNAQMAARLKQLEES